MNTVTFNRNGATRTIPVGFSWTTLLFGPLPSVTRGHFVFALKVCVCDMIAIGLAGHVYGKDWFVPLFLSLRVAISMIRNGELHQALTKNGWRRTCLDKGVELRGHTSYAANDEEEY